MFLLVDQYCINKMDTTDAGRSCVCFVNEKNDSPTGDAETNGNRKSINNPDEFKMIHTE